MKKLVALSTVGLMAAAPVFAGGMAEKVAPPTPVVVAPQAPAMPDWTGFYGGVHLGMGHTKADNGVAGGSGVVGGIQAGYLQDFGKWVAGGELRYTKSNMKLDGGAGKVKHSEGIELKAGPKFGRTFVYAALGAGRMNADFGGASHSDSGYFGGLGVDYHLNNNWSVGGEVLTGRYGNFDNTGTTLKPTTATVNVSYHF